MHPVKSLPILMDTATRRLGRLRNRADRLMRDKTRPGEFQEAVGWITLEALTLWSNFVRAYLLSTPLRPLRVCGQRITLGDASVTSPMAVLLVAARVARGPLAVAPRTRRDEPPWHDVAVLVRTCERIKASNLDQVRAAMSVSAGVLPYLPVFRNFFAHRNEDTAHRAVRLAADNYLIRGLRHPSDVLMACAYGRVQPLILDWIDELQCYVEFLCA